MFYFMKYVINLKEWRVFVL